jgi:hypothetical protein
MDYQSCILALVLRPLSMVMIGVFAIGGCSQPLETQTPATATATVQVNQTDRAAAREASDAWCHVTGVQRGYGAGPQTPPCQTQRTVSPSEMVNPTGR